MHPFLKGRASAIGYTVLCAGLAFANSTTIGLAIDLDFWQMLVNTGITTFLLFVEGLLTWSMLRYVVHLVSSRSTRGIFLVAVGFFVCVSFVGIESLAMYGFLGNGYGRYALSIPLRLLIIFLLYLLVVQYCGVEYRAEQEEQEEQEEITESIQPVIPEPTVEPVEILERISVRSGQKINVIDIEDVMFIKADGDYVSIVSKSGRWLKEQTMKYFDQHLPQNRFARIHRSYIVNMEQIARIERYGQQQLVELRNGEKIMISSTGYKLLRERLNL